MGWKDHLKNKCKMVTSPQTPPLWCAGLIANIGGVAFASSLQFASFCDYQSWY
jgi:hypothetical protein